MKPENKKSLIIVSHKGLENLLVGVKKWLNVEIDEKVKAKYNPIYIYLSYEYKKEKEYHRLLLNASEWAFVHNALSDNYLYYNGEYKDSFEVALAIEKNLKEKYEGESYKNICYNALSWKKIKSNMKKNSREKSDNKND